MPQDDAQTWEGAAMTVNPSDEAQGPSPVPWLDTCAVEGCSLRIRCTIVGGDGVVWYHVDPTGRAWARDLPPGHQATPRP